MTLQSFQFFGPELRDFKFGPLLLPKTQGKTLRLTPQKFIRPADPRRATLQEYLIEETGERILAATCEEIVIKQTKVLPQWAQGLEVCEDGLRKTSAVPPSKKGSWIGVKFYPDGTGKYALYVDAVKLEARLQKVSANEEFAALQVLSIPPGHYGTDVHDRILEARNYLAGVIHNAITDGRSLATVGIRLERARKKAATMQKPGYKPDLKKLIHTEMMQVLEVIMHFIHKNGKYPVRTEICDEVTRRRTIQHKGSSPLTGKRLARILPVFELEWIG